MKPNKKVFIKNCTGLECGRSEGERKFSIAYKFSRGMFFSLLIAFVLSACFLVFFSPYMLIGEIELRGVKSLDKQRVAQRALFGHEGKYFNFLPKNNFLFFSPACMSKELMNDFKKIESVSVQKKFPNTVIVEIKERDSLLIFCSQETCFLVDRNGTAYSNADFDSKEIKENRLIRIDDESGKETHVGDKIFTADFVSYISVLRTVLGMFSLDNDANKYSVPYQSAEELDVSLDGGPKLLYSSVISVSDTIKIMEMLFKKELPLSAVGLVEYIDLRDGNKIFYKLKNSDQTQSVEQQTAVQVVQGQGVQQQKVETKKDSTKMDSKKK